MKKNIFYIGFASLLTAGALASCSANYLDESPVTDLGTNVIVDDVAGAQVAINGLCRAMEDGYSVGANQNIGESYINTVFNDTFGPDVFGSLTSNYFSTTNFNWGAMNRTDTWYTQVLWMYPYNLINQANAIIEGVTEATAGDTAQKNFVVAQALTIRAHAYIKLLQYYAPRWEDSNNGKTPVCVIREKTGREDLPLSTMSEVLDQIYEDLDIALELYAAAPGVKRVDVWAPDASIAYGLYARAALIKNDWPTAQAMANAARQGYTVRSAADCFNGFATLTSDDMWATTTDEASSMGYWSWGVHFACNGRYTQTWQLGTNAITMDLYRQLDENDIRRDWFFTPDKIYDAYSYYPNLASTGITEADFWNPAYMGSGTMRCAGNMLLVATYYSLFQADYITNFDASNSYLPYIAFSGNGIAVVPNYFGQQYKFWGEGGYGLLRYPFMRATEMYLAEAEAAYHNGDITTAKKSLTAVNEQRISGYVCNASGQALLDEIRLCRRIELWGEGQNWSDFKRWNLPMVRTAWKANDPTSNNIPSTMAVTIAPSAFNGWRWGLSETETDYNKEALIKLITD